MTEQNQQGQIVNAPVTKEDLEKLGTNVPAPTGGPKGKVVREIKLIIRVYENGMIEMNAQGVTSPFEIMGTAELIKNMVLTNMTPRRP